MHIIFAYLASSNTHAQCAEHSTIGGAPNYYPNSFQGPVDNQIHALSKTTAVSV